MNMRRTVRVAVEELQQLACRAIVWNGIWCRPNAVICVFTVLICHELAAQVQIFLVGVLLLVVSVCGALPHINGGTLQRLLRLCAQYPTVHIYWLSIIWCVVADVGTHGQGGMVVSEEGSENGRGGRNIGGFGGFLVGDLVDQTEATLDTRHMVARRQDLRFNTQNIAHKLTFVTLFIGHPA